MAKVLLIISNKRTHDLMTGMLRMEGHEVLSAEGEQSGRALISRERPDAAIIDVSNGNLTLTAVKHEFPELPAICWMPERNSQNAISLMKSGAIDCIFPPLRAADVIGVVNHTVGMAQSKIKGTVFLLPAFTLYRYRHVLRAAGAVIGLFLLALLFWPRDHTRVYELSFKNPTGISGDGRNLWISDWYTQCVYQYLYKKDAKLKKNFYFASYGPLAVASDGKFLWTCGNDLTLRKHVISEHMEVVNSYLLKDLSPTGIVIFNDTVFISDAVQKRIYHYSVEGYLSIITSFDCPVAPVGLSFDGRNFWTADMKGDRLYVLEKSAGSFVTKAIYQLAPVAGGQIAGVYTEGEYVFVAYSGNPSKLIRYRIKDLDEFEQEEPKARKKG